MPQNLPPHLYVVSGPPASGKTTVASQLATALGVPCLSKDAIKEILYAGMPGHLDESKLLGIASLNLIFSIAQTILSSGTGVVIEANFMALHDVQRVTALKQATGAKVAELHLTAAHDVLVDRYRRRAEEPKRHVGHRDRERVPYVSRGIMDGRWGPLGFGRETITIDCSDAWPSDFHGLAVRLAQSVI